MAGLFLLKQPDELLEALELGLLIDYDGYEETTHYLSQNSLPALTVSFPESSLPVAGDFLQLKVGGVDLGSPLEITPEMIETGVLGEILDTELSEGLNLLTVIHIHGGLVSSPSNELPYVVDTTPPALTDAEGEQLSENALEFRVSTNEDTGDVYMAVTDSTSFPSSAQVIAGEDENGDVALFADDQEVTSTGVQTFSSENFLGTGDFYAYYTQIDGAGNIANVVQSPAISIVYSGPGDLQTFSWWGGLRAFTAAKAAALTPLIDVVDDSTGLITTTINSTSAGDLDIDAITALGYSVRVSRVYDQVGTSHANQTTHGNRPALNLTGAPNGKPTLAFVRANSNYLNTGAISASQPFSMLAAGQRTGNTTQGQALIGLQSSTGVTFGFGTAVNSAAMWAGSTFTNTTAADNTYHLIYGLFNGSSSQMIIDGGSPSTVNPGSNSGATFNIGRGYAGTGYLDGNFLEGGILTTGAMTNLAALTNNTKAYWGIV